MAVVSKKPSPEPASDGPGGTNAVKRRETTSAPGSGRRTEKDASHMTPAHVSSRPSRPDSAGDPGSLQTGQFEQAMTLFRGGQFQPARELFAQATEGPSRDIAFSAKMHIRMCEKRMEQAAPLLETADDYYNYGVALTNQRRLSDAAQQLEQALKMKDVSHYHYALGFCLALSGDSAAAIAHTKRAVEMDPASRTALRNDSEFMAALGNSNVQAILR